MNVQEALIAIASHGGHKFDVLETDVYRIDFGFSMSGGGHRNQYVFIRRNVNNEGEEKLYISSRCGILHEDLDLKALLKEAYYCNYAAITILEENIPDGRVLEHVMVQAFPTTSQLSQELLHTIVLEVGVKADIIEMNYFGMEDKF